VTEPVKAELELIDAMPEIQLIDLLMKISSYFDNTLSRDEKHRAIDYFQKWYEQEAMRD